METTLGKKFAELRKLNGFTQDEMAEKLGVSPQAVSKWENDLSCPDIMLLPDIAKLFDVTIDELFSDQPTAKTVILPEEQRVDIDKMMFKVVVDSKKGDRGRVNLPMPLVRLGISIGMKLPQITQNEALRDLDIESILKLVESGAIGQIVDVDSSDGDRVRIVVE